MEPSPTPAREDAPRVLVVDDERVIREILCDFLSMEGYVVRAVEDGTVALRELLTRPYDLVISDLKMPGMGGLELLDQTTQHKLNVITVIMTGFGTVETAIEAMKRGAYDYLLKPFKVEDILHVIQRGLDRQRLQAENMRLREAVSLFRVSEAIATTLELPRILDVILEAAMVEVEADAATLLLRDGKGGFEERGRRVRDPAAGALAEPDVEALLQSFRADRPILAHGLRATHFFAPGTESGRLASFASVPMRVTGEIVGMLNAYSFTGNKQFDEGQRKMLSILAGRAGMSIENARLYEEVVAKNRDLVAANFSLEENFRQSIVGFARALEESDRYTRGHSERVAVYARLIAAGLSYSPAETETVVQAALMHDIGKIGIRYEKLNKPGKLTPEEVAMFRTHPAKGKRILEPIPFMRDIVAGCYCHHEALDGSGYPQGLKGDEIPVLGRIVAVADTYDAMTSDRAYRKALLHKVAVSELERCSGTQFDPEIVAVFLREVERYRVEAKKAGTEIPR